MLETACPKPIRTEKVRKPLRPAWSKEAWAHQLALGKAAKARAIAKQKAKPRTMRAPVKKRNEKRIARKAASYRKVIASDFHKRQRYAAFTRSKGLCECDECVTIRTIPEAHSVSWTTARVDLAFVHIPVWFTLGGSAPHKRFRSIDGELHHTSYRYFGDDNPAELALVRWCWKECHRRIESEHGHRRRYLAGKGAK